MQQMSSFGAITSPGLMQEAQRHPAPKGSLLASSPWGGLHAVGSWASHLDQGLRLQPGRTQCSRAGSLHRPCREQHQQAAGAGRACAAARSCLSLSLSLETRQCASDAHAASGSLHPEGSPACAASSAGEHPAAPRRALRPQLQSEAHSGRSPRAAQLGRPGAAEHGAGRGRAGEGAAGTAGRERRPAASAAHRPRSALRRARCAAARGAGQRLPGYTAAPGGAAQCLLLRSERNAALERASRCTGRSQHPAEQRQPLRTTG